MCAHVSKKAVYGIFLQQLHDVSICFLLKLKIRFGKFHRFGITGS